MPQTCTWITAREEVRSEGGCTSSIQILGTTAIDNLLASQQVGWIFFLRVGVGTGLRGVTVESISSGGISNRHWTAEQRPAAAKVRKRFPRVNLCSYCRLAETRMEYWTAGLGPIVANSFKSRLLNTPLCCCISTMNWEQPCANGDSTMPKMVSTDHGRLILIPATYRDFV
jgi:hypothetical protein